MENLNSIYLEVNQDIDDGDRCKEVSIPVAKAKPEIVFNPLKGIWVLLYPIYTVAKADRLSCAIPEGIHTLSTGCPFPEQFHRLNSRLRDVLDDKRDPLCATIF